jgi:saccharopine dehydrogenase-like NADP-dependent oxidoreductase
MTVLVGVVGGYGAVGGAVARQLHQWFAGSGVDGRLRIGGRRLDGAQRLVSGELAGQGEAMTVDVYDDEALRRFCTGCRVVVNASAASYLVVDRVATAALAAGADYVDAGGDCPLFDRLVPLGLADTGRRALVTAGMMPGLTGLLPRWLAGLGYRKVRRLIAYVGVMDRLTPAGAVDYLLSLRGRD